MHRGRRKEHRPDGVELPHTEGSHQGFVAANRGLPRAVEMLAFPIFDRQVLLCSHRFEVVPVKLHELVDGIWHLLHDL